MLRHVTHCVRGSNAIARLSAGRISVLSRRVFAFRCHSSMYIRELTRPSSAFRGSGAQDNGTTALVTHWHVTVPLPSGAGCTLV